jgi:hypothetical protein
MARGHRDSLRLSVYDSFIRFSMPVSSRRFLPSLCRFSDARSRLATQAVYRASGGQVDAGGPELARAGAEQREAQPALLDEEVDLVEQPGQALQEEARLRQAVQAGNGLQ